MKSKVQKQDEAIARNAAYAILTPQEKLSRLGYHKARRQRAKLQAAIAKLGIEV